MQLQPRPCGRGCQLVEKVCFFKKVLVLNPYPQTPFPGKGAILLGLPPLDQARMLVVSHTKPLHDAVAQMADDLYGGYAPKQGCFGCLPKVLHDAKPAEQATLDTHFYIIKRFIDSLTAPTLRSGLYVLIWLLSAAYQLLVKFILSDTSKTSSPVGIATFPFVTVSVSLSYDFAYPSMNISGSVTVSPLFV